MNKYDVVVIGGGMIGSALALGLAKQGYRVSIIDKKAPAFFSKEQPADLRISAISMTTVKLWKFVIRKMKLLKLKMHIS